MRIDSPANQLEDQAMEALCALLGQVSVTRVKEIRRAAHGPGSECVLVAHVDALGRSHTLVCHVRPSAQPERLSFALDQTRDGESATRVVIAPYLSPEAQDLCKQSHAGFLDFEGNARLALGEVFIGWRSLAHRAEGRVAATRTQHADVLKPRPPRAEVSASRGVAAAFQA